MPAPTIPPPRRFPLRSLWDALHEPRVVTVIYLVAYLVALGMGAVTLINPPATIEGALGFITPFWGAFLALGGAVGAVACPRGVWWLERVGMGAVLIGLGMYVGTAVALHVQSSGNRLAQVGAITLAILLFLARWAHIRWAALDPTK